MAGYQVGGGNYMGNWDTTVTKPRPSMTVNPRATDPYSWQTDVKPEPDSSAPADSDKQ